MSTEKPAERCENCRFRSSILILDESGRWEPQIPTVPKGGITEREYEESRQEESGQCRRFPPQVLEHRESAFPLVLLDDWCGEYQPQEKS